MMSAWTKSEAERQYREGAARFDKWFDSLPVAERKRLRDGGVLPYREQAKPEYVFNVQGSHPVFSHDPFNEKPRTEEETFISRDKVLELIGRMLETFSVSHSKEVRLHVELLKIAMRYHGAMSGVELARMYRLTRAAVNLRVQKIRRVLEPSKKGKKGRILR